MWDHWVPNANDATAALIKEWSEKEKVEVKVDFITSQGNKLLLTGAAESQATARYKAGLGTITEVAEAQRLLTVTEIDHSFAKLQVWRAHLGVAAARGDLGVFLEMVKR